jgi:uncharacterized protein (DUF2141 family)
MLTASAFAQDPAQSIKVKVVGLSNSDGVVRCALFARADGFPRDSKKAFKVVTSRIADDDAECDFDGISAGNYAVVAYHDENANGKIDSDFLGIAAEGIGISNDAVGHFGPPRFADASFTYSGGIKLITIHINYLP